VSEIRCNQGTSKYDLGPPEYEVREYVMCTFLHMSQHAVTRLLKIKLRYTILKSLKS